MQIHWNNIVALALLIVLVVLLGKNCSAINAAVSTTTQIGPYHSPDEKVVGLVVLGLICVTLVAVVKILTSGGGK